MNKGPPELKDGAVCGPDGSGRIRMDLEGSGRMRLDADGSDWIRMDPDGSGWVRMGPDGSGWFRMDSDAAALPRLPRPLTPIRICGVLRKNKSENHVFLWFPCLTWNFPIFPGKITGGEGQPLDPV